MTTALVLLLWGWGCSPSPNPSSRPPELATPRIARVHGVDVQVGDHAVRLRTPIRTLVSEDRTVLVVGAVHVADPAYYDALTDTLAPMEVVLAEGVSPEAVQDAPPAAPSLPLTGWGLAAQSQALTHDERWLGADMTERELRAALQQAGASPSWIAALLDDRDRSTLADLFEGIGDDPRRLALARLALLHGIGDPSPTEGADADLYWEVVIGARNAVAESAILARQEPRVAVLYGADHVEDLVMRMSRAGFEEVRRGWLDAITVRHETLGLGRTQVEQLLRARRPGPRARRWPAGTPR